MTHTEIEEVTKSVRKMYDADQAMRTDPSGRWDSRLDKKHCTEFKKIFKEHGALDAVRFGMSTSFEAIILVIHFDHDVSFQKEYLSYIVDSANPTVQHILEIPSSKYHRKDVVAMLFDRILVNEKMPQEFGTQYRDERLFKIKNPSKVNEYRMAVGLDPLPKRDIN